MVDQKTAYLQLPLPFLDNSLDQDCPRMRQALTLLDDHARSTDAALKVQDQTLTAHAERLDTQALTLAAQGENLKVESAAREQGDADQGAALAALAATVADLSAKMAALDPWTIFPARVPITDDYNIPLSPSDPTAYRDEVAPYVAVWDKERQRLEAEAAAAEAARLAEYNSEPARARRLRAERDARLSASDYLLMPDYPLNDAARAVVTAYRQALRDLPQQPGAPWDGGGAATPWPALPDPLVVA